MVKFTTPRGSAFHLDAMGGGNAYQEQQRTEQASITNLLVPSFFNLSNSTSPPTTTDYTYLRRRVGLYGQATVGFKDQVFLTGNIRNDWSSTLPIENNSIFYPGANVSWIITQTLGSNNTLSFLKVRAAYGRTGSDPDPYQVQPQLGSGVISLPFGSFNSPFNGIAGYGINNTIGNPNLKPIFTNEAEVGAEARFLKDRIGLDVSLYNKNTNGQIFAVPIAPSTGYTNLVENPGRNEELHLELHLHIQQGLEPGREPDGGYPESAPDLGLCRAGKGGGRWIGGLDLLAGTRQGSQRPGDRGRDYRLPQREPIAPGQIRQYRRLHRERAVHLPDGVVQYLPV